MLAGAVMPHARVTCALGRTTLCPKSPLLHLRSRTVIRRPRTRCQRPAVAHSSLLLPDVSPESNVPPEMARAIVEYARAMPTWEVIARAGIEISLSVLLAFLVVKIIQKATNKAIHVSEHRLWPGTCHASQAAVTDVSLQLSSYSQ